MDITLAIIKPHIVRNVVAFRAVREIILNNFNVLDSKEIHITQDLLETLYAEHKGKFFYNRLTTFMSSGPCYALILESENCINKWRDLMGPTKVYKTIYTHPDSIRALYGLSDTRNACHGSDSEISAIKEISILFPNFNLERISRKCLRK